ncbi:phytase [Paludibaculum fermentans]|uniref:phytase n=1 Tax=Paludibaculum fermentans TaxID=1473598 RepID=UPI003EBA2663
MARLPPFCLIGWLALCAGGEISLPVTRFTDSVYSEAHDPAIWVNHADPGRSLIIATDSGASPHGALAVFSLDGKMVQRLGPFDRLGQVDIAYGVRWGGRKVDLAICTERALGSLRLFVILSSRGGAFDISGMRGPAVFEEPDAGGGITGAAGPASTQPTGIAVYTRPRDNAVFLMISRKSGPRDGYLWQYRMSRADGGFRLVKVREFGRFSGSGEIQAIAVDNELGYIYYADEVAGIRKYPADPDAPHANKELALFGRTEFAGRRKGIAIWKRKDGTGYIVCTDQIAGASRFHLFRREGTWGRPHNHSKVVRTVTTALDSTNGIEITSTPLGALYPHGLFVAMNSKGRNFALAPAEELVPQNQR